MMAQVSIITPYRNAGPFLDEAVASVRSQSHFDWKLLLVDDGSTDDSAERASAHASSDPRIELFATSQTTGRGAAAARNLGLAYASGDYVAFLDADDLFVRHKLERDLALMASQPKAMMVTGSTLWWYPGEEGRNWVDAAERLGGRLYAAPRLMEAMLLLQRDEVPCTCAVLIRRRAIEQVGGFEESLSLYEDQTLWAKIMARFPVYVGTHLTSVYRQHAASTSALATAAGTYDPIKPHTSRLPFLDWVAAYLADCGVVDRRTARALRLARAAAEGDGSRLHVADRAWLASCRAYDTVRWRSRRIISATLGRSQLPAPSKSSACS